MQRLFYAMLLLVTVPVSDLSAQPRFHVRGVVRDSLSGHPLENVNVFLASTTIGAGTDQKGGFVLEGVPPGSYTFIASRVGYNHAVGVVTVRDGDVTVHDIAIGPRIIAYEPVEVTGEEEIAWEHSFSLFERAFLGESTFGRQCVIRNKEVLRFDEDDGGAVLTARADRPLIVDNLALGYQLQVTLAEFRWNIQQDFGSFLIYPLFRKMTTTSCDTLVMRDRLRRKVFTQSLQRFLRSVVHRSTETDGYLLHIGVLEELQRGHGLYLAPSEIELHPDPPPLGTWWTFQGWLRVDMPGEDDVPTSFISLRGSNVRIDPLGLLDDPLSVRVMGRWAGSRVGEMLPQDETEGE
jgi:hypothetical protein